MGCDGGFVPKREEMVKVKAKSEIVDDSEMVKMLWTCCYISKKPFQRPIVACPLGRLYNKDSVVMFLLDHDHVEPSLAKELSHIHSLKGLISCNLTDSKVPESPYFACPITGREMNGKSKFVVVKGCGCVFSEQALRQFPHSKTCLVCEKEVGLNPETDDLIPLYGRPEEIEKLRQNLKIETSLKRKKKSIKSSHLNALTSSYESEESKSKGQQILEELQAGGNAIGSLKRTKVTETLYVQQVKK